MNEFSVEKIEPEVQQVVMAAPTFPKITTKDESDAVSTYLGQVKSIRAKIAEFFRPEIDAANKLHKNLLAKMKQVDAAPLEAENRCRRMLSLWIEEERARVAAEQRRLDEEARKKAIREAEKEGDTRAAKAIETGRVSVVSEKAPEPVAKSDGVSFREIWSAEVVDLKELAKAVGSGKVPVEYISPNMPTLNSVMRSTKGQINIPGVAARKETSIMKR
ncbi:MAG TPA: hypothetical protein ENN69_05600 [Spirochaetia bacterium]|nr:hypothetical protein [Spirochaetia bacterium]